MPSSSKLEDKYKNNNSKGLSATTYQEAIDELSKDRKIKLFQDKTFYVAVDGDNNNNGETNTSSWLSIQHALDYIAQNYDLNGHQVTITCISGTYNINSTIVVPEFTNSSYQFCDVVLRGEEGSSTILEIGTSTGFSIRNNASNRFCIRAFTIKGLSRATSVGISVLSHAYLDIASCFFEGIFSGPILRVENNSSISIGFLNLGNLNCLSILLAETFSTFYQKQNIAITSGSNVNCTRAFLLLFGSSAYIRENGSIFNNGTIVARRYDISSESSVQFVSSVNNPEDFFPGNLPGVISSLGYLSKNYSNTNSGLNATNIQGAIDELSSTIKVQGKYSDDVDAGNNGVSTGQYYQTDGTGASPLNVPGILMVKQ